MLLGSPLMRFSILRYVKDRPSRRRNGLWTGRGTHIKKRVGRNAGTRCTKMVETDPKGCHVRSYDRHAEHPFRFLRNFEAAETGAANEYAIGCRRFRFLFYDLGENSRRRDVANVSAEPAFECVNAAYLDAIRVEKIALVPIDVVRVRRDEIKFLRSQRSERAKQRGGRSYGRPPG